jgi:hypothetical protein
MSRNRVCPVRCHRLGTAPNAPKITAGFSSGIETCMMAITCGNVAAAYRPLNHAAP